MLFTAWPRLAPLVLLAFLPLSILWKGGKTLETTWLLVAVAWFCTLAYWSGRKEDADAPARVPLRLWVPLMLFLLWTFLSYFLSAAGNYGLDEVLRDSSFALLFLWVYRESSRDVYGLPLARRIIQILVFTAIVAAFLGIFVYVFQPVSRFVGSFFDPRFHTDYWPNAWAELILMVWPIVWAWSPPLPAGEGRVRGRQKVWLCMSGLLFSSLFLSYSRAAYIAFGIQILLLGFIYWKRERNILPFPLSPRERVRVRGILSGLLALLCITAGIILSLNALRAQFAPVQSAVEKLTFAAAEGTSSVTERQQFWKEAQILARERPLFGWGPYSFRFVQTRLQEGVFATSDHAHSIFLKYAAERGWPAALLFALFLITILRSAPFILSRKNSQFLIPNSQFPFSFHLPLTISVTGVLLHLLLDFNLHFVGVALPFWLLLAILSRELWQQKWGGSLKAERWKLKAAMRFAEISLATALMVIAIFEGRFLLISSLGRHAEARGDFLTALQWYGRSRGGMFSRDLHLSRAHLSLVQKKPDDAIRALDDYFRMNRQDARAWKILGDTEVLRKNFSAARQAYEEALRLGQWNHLGALRGLLDVLRAQGERDSILERRAEFDAILTAYLDAIERNTHFIALTPNVEDFLAVTSALAELFPKDAPQYQAMGARADRHARAERERIAARPVGRLW